MKRRNEPPDKTNGAKLPGDRPEPAFRFMRLRHVRCFENVKVPFDPRVTVIIGENGSGKTTIAEALASLTFGDGEGLREFPLRRGRREGAIELYDTGAGAPVASWTAGEKAERERLPIDRYLFAYGRYRRVQYPEVYQIPGGPEILGPEWDQARYASPQANLSTAVQGRRTATLTEPDHHLLRDLGRYLRDFDRLRASDPKMEAAWAQLDQSVYALGEGLEGMEGNEGAPMIRRRGVPFELRELSDGYQAILVIVFDLLLRYLYLPPLLENPLARAATVVIDEVDLHLHPRWQRRVVRQLTRLFPGTQFILTTHSPAVVQGAIDFGHKVLVLREQREGVAVRELGEKDRRALQGAQLGSVLVDNRLFGVTSRYSARYEAIEKKVRQLRKKVEAGTATDEDREELLQRLDRLEELAADEEERQAGGPLLSEIAKVQLASLKRLVAMNKGAKDGAT